MLNKHGCLSGKTLTKICSKCHREKLIGNFYKHGGTKDGLDYLCKICSKKRGKQSRLKNSQYYKQYRLEHSEYFKQERRQWKIKNPEYQKQYNKQYKLENPDYFKQYRLKNKRKMNQKDKQYKNQRYKNDINYKILCDCRAIVYQALRNKCKSACTMKLIMCTVPELKLHIEKQFLTGMSWNNWGSGLGKWQIDHIVPISFFVLQDPIEQHMCFRFDNLQPLWWKDNNKKSDKIILQN